MLVGRDHRHWSICPNRGPRPALASLGQQTLARAQGGESGGENLECRQPPAVARLVNRRFETRRFDHVPNTSQWSRHRSGAGFQHSARRAKNELGGTTPSPAFETSCRGVVDTSVCISSCSQTDDWIFFAGRVRWIWLRGKGNKSFRFMWICARHRVWTQV